MSTEMSLKHLDAKYPGFWHDALGKHRSQLAVHLGVKLDQFRWYTGG